MKSFHPPDITHASPAEAGIPYVERYYQTRCRRRSGEAFEKDHGRKPLVVMATGGKTRGLKVAGGDRPGKTIHFAKNQAHAEFIAARFDANYPHLRGVFVRGITLRPNTRRL